MSERLGRRALWLLSAVGCLCAYILIIICSAVFATRGAAAAGQATIAFIYLVSAKRNITARSQTYLPLTVQRILRRGVHVHRHRSIPTGDPTLRLADQRIRHHRVCFTRCGFLQHLRKSSGLGGPVSTTNRSAWSLMLTKYSAWKYYFVFVAILCTCIANIWFV